MSGTIILTSQMSSVIFGCYERSVDGAQKRLSSIKKFTFNCHQRRKAPVHVCQAQLHACNVSFYLCKLSGYTSQFLPSLEELSTKTLPYATLILVTTKSASVDTVIIILPAAFDRILMIRLVVQLDQRL